VAEVPVDAQRLLQVPGRPPMIPGQSPQFPQVIEGVGLAGPVAEVPCGAQGGDMAGDGLSPRAFQTQQAGQPGPSADSDPQLLAS
jgi:hypothetical protein